MERGMPQINKINEDFKRLAVAYNFSINTGKCLHACPGKLLTITNQGKDTFRYIVIYYEGKVQPVFEIELTESQYFALKKQLNKILEYSQKKYESEEDLQMILFSGEKKFKGKFEIEKADEFPQKVLLENEKEYLGIYVSSHPLNEKKNLINIISHDKISEISQKELKKVRIIGIVKNVKKFATRAGKEPMVKFEMEDFQKNIEVVCFPREYVTFGYKITEGQIMVLEGIVNSEQNKNTVILNNICNIENLEENKNLKLYILIDEEVKEKNQKLKEIILKNKGDNQVFLAFKTNEKKEVVKLSKKYNVNLSLKFIRKVAKLFGIERIKLR